MPSLKNIAVTAAFSVVRIVTGVVVASAILATVQSVAHAETPTAQPYPNLGAYRIACMGKQTFASIDEALHVSLRCRATEAAFKLPAPAFATNHPTR